MRRQGIALLAAIVAPVAAHAAPPVLLPSPVRAPTATPPLATGAVLTETRWRGRLTSDERVVIGLDPVGRPVSVKVVQRLVVGGVGDYVLVVPAPVRGVRRVAGSAADPGFRSGAVLWQGFSPGGERLIAAVDLRTDAAAPSLPLRLTVTRRPGLARVRIANATAVEVAVPTGVGRPRELAAILRGLRSSAPTGDVFAHLEGPPGSRTARVEAPLRVNGEIVSGARHLPVHVVLGGGEPLATTLDVRGADVPRVRLTVQPFLPTRLLRLPRGLDGARALDYTVEALVRASRVAQYQTFLANPDRRGPSAGVYELRTATRPAAAPAAPRDQDGGLGVLGIALWIAGGAAALISGAVLWSRS
jgi:hypothetical protein